MALKRNPIADVEDETPHDAFLPREPAPEPAAPAAERSLVPMCFRVPPDIQRRIRAEWWGRRATPGEITLDQLGAELLAAALDLVEAGHGGPHPDCPRPPKPAAKRKQ